jgi:acyl-CoA ligase (AMP-forming) (exosortase A-associated)
MTVLLQDLINKTAARTPNADALKHRDTSLTYAELRDQVNNVAAQLIALGMARSERVAVYLEKRIEAVTAMFGAAAGGGVFVPVSPVLRPNQVAHILKDCNVRVLITSRSRIEALVEVLPACRDLNTIVLVDGAAAPGTAPRHVDVQLWEDTLGRRTQANATFHRVVDIDMAAIFYTSGSTGMPKGVVLSHRNLVTGALSVSEYLENTPQDRILSLLALNFDAGFSQLTTGFYVGAAVILTDFLFPRDVISIVAKEKITGIGGVPPLWNQLADLPWPEEAKRSMRYFSNTGDRMPKKTLELLRKALPDTKPYLMYGLTESFRSTYLPPSEVDRRPDSIGKAVPNAEILVVREDGTLCGPNEPGQLVHRGAFVSLGYWNDPERTAERFKPVPGQPGELVMKEMAVWSGDTVRMDEEGFLYFIGRTDGMIKTSGYRVSPTEVEDVVYAHGGVKEVVAVGVPHPTIGQGIVVVCTPREGNKLDDAAILEHCRRELPMYMVPHHVIERQTIERNANGKIDRKQLADELSGLFKDS